jgi:hypothetical protein
MTILALVVPPREPWASTSRTTSRPSITCTCTSDDEYAYKTASDITRINCNSENLAENNMLAIEPRSLNSADEELAAVSVSARIGLCQRIVQKKY